MILEDTEKIAEEQYPSVAGQDQTEDKTPPGGLEFERSQETVQERNRRKEGLRNLSPLGVGTADSAEAGRQPQEWMRRTVDVALVAAFGTESERGIGSRSLEERLRSHSC